MSSRIRRILRTTTATFLVIATGLAIYTWRHVSPAGPTYSPTPQIDLPFRLRNGDEHDAARARNGGNPYILHFEIPDAGALLYYGASHTQDPGHPQIADITAKWAAFQPTVALYEGRARNHVYGALIEPFAGLPEPALVHKLARRSGTTLYTLEPSYADEVASLVKTYTPQEVALYFFLRVYIGETGGRSDEALAKDLLRKRTDVDGLHDALSSLEDVTRLWHVLYPDLGDWRTATGEPEHGVLADISTTSRQIRGEHMARTLIDLVKHHERVFAVVGSGHVIRQEWNLRAAFDQEPAWDQQEPPDSSSTDW